MEDDALPVLGCRTHKERMENDYGFRVVVRGKTACFPRPEFWRDEISYDILTPGAARGVLDRIHWRPAIRWVIDSIAVLAPIQFRERGIRSERRSVILQNVGYIIDAHFDMTHRAGPRDEPLRHRGMARRQLKGGISVFLGSEEHPGEAMLLEDSAEDQALPIEVTRDLGWMVYEADYEDRKRLRFFRAEMIRGVIPIPPRDSVSLFG